MNSKNYKYCYLICVICSVDDVLLVSIDGKYWPFTVRFVFGLSEKRKRSCN